MIGTVIGWTTILVDCLLSDSHFDFIFRTLHANVNFSKEIQKRLPDGTTASDSLSDSVSELEPTSSSLTFSYCLIN